ncbi:A/B/D/E cyclin [Piedraia hortae CBS 480.64]|uniref:A/B/D/E cyclin n=1 Tax=Piedraia hortae CBS 480.64 TaxID=1314780 RepID=A0A6A7C5I7_9PEZI|nr:A/B/D/E cyclin [Piedraia hortae CBS 480.64]
MPPARATRRAQTDENADAIPQRVTRAKAAALETGAEPKKALAAKRTTTTAASNGAQAGRKRTALVDVSNQNKKDTDKAEGKKDASGKLTLAKTAKPTGISKTTRTTTSRTVKPAPAESKRAASGSGVGGHVSKKRNTTQVVAEEVVQDEVVTEKSTVTTSVATKVEETEDLETGKPTIEDIVKLAKDLDAEDSRDPVHVSEYVHEIFEYMRELEVSTQPNPDYMDHQADLEWKMRGILVDWLLEVHTRFRLLPETLFLAVNIIDRFLSCKVVQLDRLQLVGVTAMFIASKYEEVLSPHVMNFVHVADDGFSETEILSAERFILASLDYDLSYPNPMNFLRRISKADRYDVQTRTLGKYLVEIACLDHRFIKYVPSHVSAAAMYLARLALDRGEWDANLTKYSGYTEEQIQPVFKLMVDYLQGPVVHDAFFRKYASKKFLKASIVLRAWARKWGPHFLGQEPKAQA